MNFQSGSALGHALLLMIMFLSQALSSAHHKDHALVHPAPFLNSERIQQKFGSYGVDVLEQSENLRISNLYSLKDGNKVCRTLAIVEFVKVIPELIKPAHHLITEKGESIGSTLQKYGWGIKKQHFYFGQMQQIPQFMRTLMGDISEQPLAVHAYKLFAAKDGYNFLYCTIYEIHHPDYVSERELRAIYDPSSQIITKSDPIDHIFEMLRSNKRSQQ